MRKWEGSGKDIDFVPETDEIVAENSVIQANGKGIVPMETDTQNESSSLVDTGPSYSLDEIRAMNLGAIEKLLETKLHQVSSQGAAPLALPIDHNTSFVAFGLDSMTVVQFKGVIENR